MKRTQVSDGIHSSKQLQTSKQKHGKAAKVGKCESLTSDFYVRGFCLVLPRVFLGSGWRSGMAHVPTKIEECVCVCGIGKSFQ